MDDSQRLQLNTMIKENNVEDNTELIRNLKHSSILSMETDKIVDIKKANPSLTPEELNVKLSMECQFMFTYYTDIYNKIRKDEIDVALWKKTLALLKRIEDGEVDQHEGSFMFGTLMKEVYIDSALRKAAKLNNPELDISETKKEAVSNISWKQFKRNPN
jgi:hypothetical protein